MKNIRNKLPVIAIAVALIIVGFAGVYTYLTKFGNLSEEAKQRQQEKENAICGTWEAKNGMVMNIWRDQWGVFHALIEQSNGKDTVIQWEMSGQWSDDIKGFSYADGLKTKIAYNTSGEEKTTIQYDLGEGKIRLKRNGLRWDDEQENIAKGERFSYIGEY